MKRLAGFVMMLALLSAGAAFGQASRSEAKSSHLEVAGQFTAVYANAAPGDCGCFFMVGVGAQMAAVRHNGLAVVVDYGRTQASNINGYGHDLTLSTYMAGPRYYAVRREKVAVYGQVLAGAAHTDSNYAIDDGVTRFGAQIGGGMDYKLAPKIRWRVFEADYLLTRIPNAKNEIQNQTRLSSGIVFRF